MIGLIVSYSAEKLDYNQQPLHDTDERQTESHTEAHAHEQTHTEKHINWDESDKKSCLI